MQADSHRDDSYLYTDTLMCKYIYIYIYSDVKFVLCLERGTTQRQNKNEPWPRTQKGIVPKTPTAHHDAIGGRGVREAAGDGRRAVRGGRGGS